MASSKLFQNPIFKQYWKKFLFTTPWILYILFADWMTKDTICSKFVNERLEFALYYHLLATALIIVVFGVKYHAFTYELDITKSSMLKFGTTVLEGIRLVNAGIAIFGLYLSLYHNCSEDVRALIMVYVGANILINLVPILQSIVNFCRGEKKKPEPQKAETKKA